MELGVENLINQFPQKILIKDLDLNYVACNAGYAADRHLDMKEIRGKTDYDLHPRELADKYRNDDRRILKSGSPESYEDVYVYDGKKVHIYITKTPLKDAQGRAIGILGVFWISPP